MSIKEMIDVKIGEAFDRDASRVYRERVSYYANNGATCTDRQSVLIRKEAEQTVMNRFPYSILRKLF
jgi:ribosomal protein S16